ncbi:unnamed protein product [Cylindrotheca closterium]|uniref:Protein cereblon n=1 Tax=Cylindrotheca closterium TaxID=2856 RepID=A0AAD2FF60_9STRA|nr:unnamed protein product [Cylindrotheca closterium]
MEDDTNYSQDQASESSFDENSTGASNLGDSSVALPRDHSYLVTAHPLLSAYKPQKISNNISNRRFVDLPVLELYGVVLFPGSTIPVKLRERSWIEYLGRQIAIMRELPHLQSEVRLGILAYKPDPTERRRGRASSDRSLAGRIGTIATIKYTHERTDMKSNTVNGDNVWQRYQNGTELVFTAVGTHRFRIVGPASSSEQGSTLGDRIYEVEELMDTSLPLPPIQRMFSTPPEYSKKDSIDDDSVGGEMKQGSYVDESNTITQTNDRLYRHTVRAWCLAQITPTPYFVHRNKSPWRLVSQVVEKINASGGRNHLPCLVDEVGASSSSPSVSVSPTLSHPTKFSFWCASNLALSESDRLALLETSSTYERLLLLDQHVEELSSGNRPIVCARCDQSLSTVKFVFTVQGAEGTTSAYVNDHGYIHQITTLRLVDVQSVMLEGDPHTENSYFPGYSWTVCYCRSCLSLLGWMFRRVHHNIPLSKDRPNNFFGFQSSSVLVLEGRDSNGQRNQISPQDQSVSDSD